MYLFLAGVVVCDRIRRALSRERFVQEDEIFTLDQFTKISYRAAVADNHAQCHLGFVENAPRRYQGRFDPSSRPELGTKNRC